VEIRRIRGQLIWREARMPLMAAFVVPARPELVDKRPEARLGEETPRRPTLPAPMTITS
jgi:hypothetical protein